MASRGRHVGRTAAQKKDYVENIVRGQDVSSTFVTQLLEDGASTDSPSVKDETAVRERVSRGRLRQSFWERYKSEIIRGGITVFLAACGLGLVALNREVGQLQQASQDTSRQLSELRGNTTRLDDKLEALRDKLDQLRER